MLLAAATVNWNDVRQTIDGFGASSAWMWGTIPQTALDQLYSTTSGAGLSLLRSHIYPQGWSSEIGVMQQVAPYGVTVWSTPWSPPRDWKTNNDNNHGGYLDPSHYQDYATQLATYALNMKALGVPLYAISLQNEPDMNVDYESCLWTEDQFAAFLPVVGETFAARGVTAKIMLPENSNWSFDKANSIMANPNLSKYVGILAAHNYDRTYHPYDTVNGVGGLPLWQTEVFLGAGVSEITDGLTLSNDIHTALTVGGASAYHYWWLSAGGVGGLMSSSWVASKRLWAMGQYSRFVRPGWVMIGETDDGGLDITTFKNPASGEFAIVASNSGATNISETFTFNGFTTASVTPYITSGTAGDDIKQYADITTTAGGSFVGVIAANSIVTYTGIVSAAPTLQAPTNLRALPQYQNQTTQIALSWDDNSTTETNYTVERSTDGNTWSVITSTLGINTMSYVDTGRTENTLYYYRVKVTNGAISSPYSAVVSCRTILAAPWGIGTWGSNPSGVNLGWNNSSAVSTGTTIERSLDGLTWTLIATLGRTTAYSDTIPGYNANQLYCYRIRNTAGDAISAYSSYNTTLKAPTSFTTSSIGATQITFTWVNNTSSAIGNWIEQYNPSTSSWNTVSPSNLAGYANSYTITGLTENTSYRFRLRSSAAGDSIWSAYTAEATPSTLFAAPTDLTAIAVSSTQTNLVWTDNSAIETNYTVERSTNGSSWTVLSSTLAANTISYSDNSTPTGTVYYRVKATTSTASSIYATTQRIAAAPVITATPSPVTGTSAALSVPALVGFGNGSLTYTWSTIGTPPTPVTFSVNGTSTSNSTTATFTKAGTYTFRIVVTDSAGLSTTNTLALTVNQTLTTITVTANGGAIVKSTWQKCTATAYDQFGDTMATQPTFTWSVVSGGGSISSAGLYAAPSSAATPVVKAASGSISGLLTLSVLDTAQLKAVYSFNEGSGNTAHDQLGVGVDGILSWGVNYTTGRLGDSLQFDGSTGSVWLGNPASLDIVGQITMAAWIKPTSSSGIQDIVGRSYGLWPNQAETVLRINAGKYEVGIWNGATTVASYSVPAGDINTWVHLAGTYDGKTWRLYRNGSLVASATTSIGSMHVLKAWRIGSSDFPDRYFNGCIDSVRLYAQPLTAGEIAALAAQRIIISSPATASPSPVVGATTNLAVAAIDPDSNSDANFIYTWSTTGTPPAAVSFSANGTNAAKNTTATFTKAGFYSFQVTITDTGGLSTTSSVSVTVVSTIAGRNIFYNGSKFDSISDDNAIATDKQALLPGGTATFANYTSYSRGINGIMIDIQRLANPAALTAADFQFKLGNDSTPSAWTTASEPISITVRQGAGVSGSDRVTIVWADNAIQNQWLQVTVKADANTGLAADDVFYFGNLIGESGDSSAIAAVDLNDEIASRTHKTGFSAATIVNLYDYNRDGKVNATDDLIARHNASNTLELITPVAGSLAAMDQLQPMILTQEETPVLTSVTSVAYVTTSSSADASAEIPKMTLPLLIDNVIKNHLTLFLSDSLQRPAEPITSETPLHSPVSPFADFQVLRKESHQGLIGKSNSTDSTQYLLHHAVFSDRSNWAPFARHRLPRHKIVSIGIDVNIEDCLSDDYEPGL
jgi:glucuronoarabinoxylan endo-1,4-beta-xylanase